MTQYSTHPYIPGRLWGAESMVIVLGGGGMNLMTLILVSFFCEFSELCCWSKCLPDPIRPQWEPSFCPRGASSPVGICPPHVPGHGLRHSSFSQELGKGPGKVLLEVLFYVLYSALYFLLLLFFLILEIPFICCLKSKSRYFTNKVYIRSQTSNSLYIGKFWFSG